MSVLPRRISLLAHATLPDGSRCDVELTGDTVSAVLPAGTAAARPTAETIDLSGYLLLTAPAEPHAHLDKALSFDLINPPMGDLGLAIASWRDYSAGMTVTSIADRARAAALLLVQNGTTAVRCHVDVLTGDDPLRGVRALLQVRAELAGVIDIELAALAGPGIPSADIEAALDLGVDLVGGAPHIGDDPSADLKRLLAIAAGRGIGVDIHTDENLDGAVTLNEMALAVRDWPRSMPVTAGHCVRLGTLELDELDAVIVEVLASDIGIVTLPITNLYLQGWEHPVSTPRGITATRRLLDAGVRLAAGADNVRDPFNPVGRSDALETASLLVTAGHLTLTEAYDAVSSGARDVMNLPVAGVIVGAKAELLAVRGKNLADVVANAPADRFVIHRGSLIAQSETTHRMAPVRSTEPLLETR